MGQGGGAGQADGGGRGKDREGEGAGELVRGGTGGQQGQPDLLWPRQHIRVPEDGDERVEGAGEVREVEDGEGSREVGHGKDHAVALPLQAVLYPELRYQLKHVGVGLRRGGQGEVPVDFKGVVEPSFAPQR